MKMKTSKVKKFREWSVLGGLMGMGAQRGTMRPDGRHLLEGRLQVGDENER